MTIRGESMDYVEYYRQKYQVEDPWHFGDSPYEKVRHAAMIEFVRHLNPKRVLDLGCGEGHFLSRLISRAPGIRAVGVELNEQAALRCRARLTGHPVEIVSSDLLDYLSKPPEPASARFDVAVCGDVLYHLSPGVVRERVLPTLPAFLRPGAGLVLSYADVNDHDWTVDVFKGRFTLTHSVYVRPMCAPPPWPWMVALLILEGQT